jgi:outer membrane biosynthesis protein TonB
VKTQPTLSLEQRRLIMKETIVQVRVSVDKNGKVTKAEPIPEKGTNIFLVSAAVEAAHLWRFKPAQSNHQPVVSESILQFVFKP